jgi:hypothetical protein
MARRISRTAALAGLTALLAACCTAFPAGAAAAPVWDVKATWGDTNLPGSTNPFARFGQFTVQVQNVGDELVEEDLTITDQLPAGVTVTAIHWDYRLGIGTPNLNPFCSGVGTGVVTCVAPGHLLDEVGGQPAPAALSGYLGPIFIDVKIPPGASGTATNVATVSGGGAAAPFTDEDQVLFADTPSPFGIRLGSFLFDNFSAAYPFGEPSRQAGDRPHELRVAFEMNQKTGIGEGGTRYADSNGLLRTVEATIPRGMIGNPEAVPKCDPVDFATLNAGDKPSCPADTQIGYLNLTLGMGTESYGRGTPAVTYLENTFGHIPIYNLEPPTGAASDFGIDVSGFVQAHIYSTLDPAQGYAIKTVTPNISALDLVKVRDSELTFWGVPGDPAHDRFRRDGASGALGASFGSAAIRPFLTNPMDCGFDNGGARIRVDSYKNPGNFTAIQEYPDPMNVEGCDDPRFRFEPEVSLQPTSRDAGAPTGLKVNLQVPQRDDTVKDAKELYAANGDVQAIPIPPMKKAVVTLPQGMAVNPAAAQGLGSCSPQQIGLGTDKPVTCPDNSQYGTLTLRTPLLPVNEQPEGFVYIAKQNDNPFHNFLSLYLVIQEPDRGILVKVPGRVDLDPQTGQITTTFDDLPQFPLEDMEMNLKGGLRAGLVNPQTCGTKTIEATFYSWHDPATPHTVNSSYEVTQSPDGSPCRNSLSERPFDPKLSGGTRNNLAGSFSPLEIQLTRTDDEQELSGVEGTAPPGLLASLRGVGRCTDAAIAAASADGRTGLEEIANPSCPASSLVGTVDAGAGVGQVLTYVQGKIYMAGPYKGAPLSGVAIVPAVAGPFDLGTIVTRAPAYPDPRTAEIKLVTDPLPLIFKGVPVRVRDIQVHLDRPNFTLNPTSCNPFRLEGTLFSSEGKSKTDGSPFQAAECASLGFKPRLSASLFGGTKRGSHPKFRATFRARPGDANVSGAVVTLPRSAFLDQAHIRTICTRVQFKANACPQGAIYGHAEASTPLLDQPLRGPVYLRSSDNELPDLVADLNGEIPVEVVGRVDSIRGGIRTTFESVPDAPVTSFAIAMQGGKKGLLVNSRDVCARTYRLDARFEAQNGRRITLRPPLKANCKAKRKAKRKR